MASTDKPTVTEFRIRFKAYSNGSQYSQEMIEMYIDEAANELSVCAFGAHYKTAVLFLAAHKMTIELRFQELEDGTPGEVVQGGAVAVNAVQSATVGDTSATYNIGASSAEDKQTIGSLDSTWMGQEFLRLKEKVCKGGLIANVYVTQGICAPTEYPVN